VDEVQLWLDKLALLSIIAGFVCVFLERVRGLMDDIAAFRM
jgi:hypothetical protein